ncbi:formin-like protein 3, partial [Neopelma chrysocephalum]|uniref:formin-like protein 3 n=1 Tax=Neopelma chrysocephalum TaxID=114329 RepID=UPI000FCD4A8C
HAPLLVAPPLVTLGHAPHAQATPTVAAVAGHAPLVTSQGAGLNLGLGLALAAPPRAAPTLLAPPTAALPAASLATPPPSPSPAPPGPALGKGAGPVQGAGPGAGPPLAAFALGGPQRLLLAPEMQARLPSGELVSLSQLAALAQRAPPPPAVGGAKPSSSAPPPPVAPPPAAAVAPPPAMTLQLQGSKLTLAPAPPLRHLALATPPRAVPRNVVHLVAAGAGQHLLGPAHTHVTLLAPLGPPVGTP